MTNYITKCVSELLLRVLALVLINAYTVVDGKDSSNITGLNTTYAGAQYDEKEAMEMTNVRRKKHIATVTFER